MLEAFGHTIVGTALNGQIAIDFYKNFLKKPEKKPEIIIMDHRMPIKNGIETTIEILSLDPNAKIIFTTADESIKNEALKKGVFCVINKPFNYDELSDCINKALQK